MTAATETQTYRWVAKGFTDDVTTCDHCGRIDLKGTVRMVATGPDGAADEDGEQYMGVICAAKMTGRKAAQIRTEAQRADRDRIEAQRLVWRAWQNEYSDWYIAGWKAELGPDARPLAIMAWDKTDEFKAAKAAWIAEHPQPALPENY